jgi:hypothetical protein
MTCFEISVNGKKVCTSGLPDGVVSLHVDWLSHLNKGASQDILQWVVTGLTEERGFKEHVRWTDLEPLSVGDVVSVRIISSDHADEPRKRERIKDD